MTKKPPSDPPETEALGSVDPNQLKVRCPVCKSFARWKDNAFRPFCSEACKKRDLGNWAMEAYRIPGPPADPTAETKNPPKKGEEE